MGLNGLTWVSMGSIGSKMTAIGFFHCLTQRSLRTHLPSLCNAEALSEDRAGKKLNQTRLSGRLPQPFVQQYRSSFADQSDARVT
jgi:hypothetical protein